MTLKAKLEQLAHRVWSSINPISIALTPLSWITARVIKRKHKTYLHNPGWHPNVPVIIVGNIFVGGTGKTPVVISLTQTLFEKGWRPGVVSRGYGVKSTGKAQAGRGRLDPNTFGDEPALISSRTNVPVSVHPKRVEAVQLLLKEYPETNVIISDDGLQHLQLDRDIEIIVQDSRGIGNGLLLPAGPLREPEQRLNQADVIITNQLSIPDQQDKADDNSIRLKPYQTTMMLKPTYAMHISTGKRIQWEEWLVKHIDTPIAAVAGIGHPKRFFAMLANLDIQIGFTRTLPDHGKITQSDFQDINQEIIVVTAKDAIKCDNINDDRVWSIEVEPVFSNPDWIDHITRRLAQL